MSQSKVTIDSLTLLSNELRNNAESILSIKDDMDTLLNSFVWDDPVAISFKERYEEGLKPITNKLIPNIENYLGYISQLGGTIEEYSGDSSIHIAGGSGIAHVLPKGSKVDPITIGADTRVHIPDSPIEEVSSDSMTIPETVPRVEIDEPILVDGREIELVLDANGMGTQEGFGHVAGRLGAGIDSLANHSKVVSGVAKGASQVVDSCITSASGLAKPGACVGAAATLVGLGALGIVTTPEGVEQLDREAGDPHDVCYLKQLGRDYCDDKLEEKAPISAGFVRRFGGKAYKEAGEEYKQHLEITAKTGKEAPPNYHWRFKPTKA